MKTSINLYGKRTLIYVLCVASASLVIKLLTDWILFDITPTVNVLEVLWTGLSVVILARAAIRARRAIKGLRTLERQKREQGTTLLDPAILRAHSRAQRFLVMVIVGDCMMLAGFGAMFYHDRIASTVPLLFIAWGIALAVMGELEEHGDKQLAEYDNAMAEDQS